MTHSCGLCNKSYTRKTSYDRHVILCEILHQSKREKKCKGQELSDIPSHTQLFLIVQELALKNQILETKMIEMQKWVETKKKKKTGRCRPHEVPRCREDRRRRPQPWLLRRGRGRWPEPLLGLRLGRRALAWHYDDFDTIDDATATRLLEAQ